MKSAWFLFYGSLNFFLSSSKKDKWISYEFYGQPAIKDAIEALGVPHVEVAIILKNGQPVQFFAPLLDADRVEVFPSGFPGVFSEKYSLTKKETGFKTFVLDVHLGKLAKALRLLGFDTVYETDYSDHTIVQMAAKESRIVLTRDLGLLKHKAVERGYYLRSQQWEDQLAEVLQRFKLAPYCKPFTRCLACNGLIEPVEKEKVLEQLPHDTKMYFNEFYRCTSCKRVYWKGSHFERMQQFVQRVFNKG